MPRHALSTAAAAKKAALQGTHGKGNRKIRTSVVFHRCVSLLLARVPLLQQDEAAVAEVATLLARHRIHLVARHPSGI